MDVLERPTFSPNNDIAWDRETISQDARRLFQNDGVSRLEVIVFQKGVAGESKVQKFWGHKF
jgi:hypothetical protein